METGENRLKSVGIVEKPVKTGEIFADYSPIFADEFADYSSIIRRKIRRKIREKFDNKNPLPDKKNAPTKHHRKKILKDPTKNTQHPEGVRDVAEWEHLKEP